MPDDLLPFVLAFLGIPVVIAVMVFMSGRARERRGAEVARRLQQMLADGSYFTSPEWLQALDAYRRYRGFGRISMKSLSADLRLRHMKGMLVRHGSWLLLVAVLPPMVLTAAALILLRPVGTGDEAAELSWALIIGATFLPEAVIVLLLMLTCRSWNVLDKWMEKNPGLRGAMQWIENSYLSGKALECGPCCLVLSKDYVHAYNGTEFMTVERQRITRLSWHVEFHRLLNRGRLWQYETCFYLALESSRGGSPYLIQMDQFQIRLFMDEFGLPVTAGCDRCGDFREVELRASQELFTTARMGRCSKPVIPGLTVFR